MANKNIRKLYSGFNFRRRNPHSVPSHFGWRNSSLVGFHHFLSLVIAGYVRPRYRVRSSRHLAFGCPLILFRCLVAHSVILIVHLLSPRQETRSAHLCLPVSIMSFTTVCCQIQVLLFMSGKVMLSVIRSILRWVTASVSAVVMVLSAYDPPPAEHIH